MDVYLERMRSILKDKFDIYCDMLDDPPYRGFRINTLKADESVLSLLPFAGERVPFCDTGYYLISDGDSAGNHPLHMAGAIYIQEPSAMCAVEMLDVREGDRVLDLCAAPGSKSTQIGAKLGGRGLLWSNEIVRNRAGILLSNIERTGIRNAVVSSLSPDVLCPKLEYAFDRILVDAPCSGEGMFRKEPKARDEWSVEHVLSCAERQYKILESAKLSLKKGGVLVYSTCTFSREENEMVIERFLKNNPDFVLEKTKRIYPFDGGEGHFAAELSRTEGEDRTHIFDMSSTKCVDPLTDEFLSDILSGESISNIYVNRSDIYALPFTADTLKSLKGISFIRAGLKIGEIKGKRIEPHHSLFSALKKDEMKRNIDLGLEDERLYRYLKGEEIETDSSIRGYTGVSVLGVSLGFGKASAGRLKNKYPKGLRIF